MTVSANELVFAEPRAGSDRHSPRHDAHMPGMPDRASKGRTGLVVRKHQQRRFGAPSHDLPMSPSARTNKQASSRASARRRTKGQLEDRRLPIGAPDLLQPLDE